MGNTNSEHKYDNIKNMYGVDEFIKNYLEYSFSYHFMLYFIDNDLPLSGNVIFGKYAGSYLSKELIIKIPEEIEIYKDSQTDIYYILGYENQIHKMDQDAQDMLLSTFSQTYLWSFQNEGLKVI